MIPTPSYQIEVVKVVVVQILMAMGVAISTTASPVSKPRWEQVEIPKYRQPVEVQPSTALQEFVEIVVLVSHTAVTRQAQAAMLTADVQAYEKIANRFYTY